MSRTSLALVTALLASLVSPAALASPTFARGIEQTLGLNYEPPCSICHQLGKTSAATPIEPFALSMRKRGLGEGGGSAKGSGGQGGPGGPDGGPGGSGGGPGGSGGGPGGGGVTQAILADESDEVDSDGDGITDVEELRHGTDVNSPANACIIPMGTVVDVDAGQCAPGTQASPSLGCSARGSPSSAGACPTGGALALLALLALTRRRVRPASWP